MLALHETTRKIICRLAFVALCVAPSLLVAAWISDRHWPGRKGRIARELGQHAGVHVKLDDWRTPRPGLIRSSGMVISDPRTALELIEVEGLEVRAGGRQRTFKLDHATIQCEQLAVMATRVETWLANLPAQEQEIRIGALELKAGGTRFMLKAVQGRVERDASGRPRARLTGYSSASEPTNTPALQLTFVASSEAANASPTLVLQSFTPIPASALAAVAPGFDSFGKTATFTGTVRWALDPSAMRGAISGCVQKADLASLTPAGSPHQWRGLATIKLDELRWVGPRIERLAGSLASDRAQVGQSLVEALENDLRCKRATEGLASAIEPAIIEVDATSMRFELDDRGLTLWGECPAASGAPRGCLMMSGGRPLLIQPPFQGIPVGVLVKVLSAPPPAWLPATREAVEMAERLPLPNAAVVR